MAQAHSDLSKALNHNKSEYLGVYTSDGRPDRFGIKDITREVHKDCILIDFQARRVLNRKSVEKRAYNNCNETIQKRRGIIRETKVHVHYKLNA